MPHIMSERGVSCYWNFYHNQDTAALSSESIGGVPFACRIYRVCLPQQIRDIMLHKWGLFGLTLIAGLILAILAVTPPSPQGAGIAADQFSSGRAMADVKIIAAKPHPTGSDENAKVRDYLLKRLEGLGLETSVSASDLDARSLARLNKWSGEAKASQTLYNVIGVLPGQDRSKPALLLMAHHDTVWGSPGAADDTIGIASIFEIIRAVNEGGDVKRDVIVLFTDAEELGLVGARHFFKNHPLADRVGAVINFEARGGGGTANMFQTSAENGAAARLYARSVKAPSVSSLSVFVYNLLPNDTDLTPALEKDYTAYNIANLARAEYYHSPKINAAALDEATLQHMGVQALDLTRALLSADDFPPKTPDATFFDVFGMVTVIYAPFWGWVFLTMGALCYALSANFKSSRKEIISGAVRMFGFLGLGGALLYGVNRLSGHGPSADYYDRLAAIPRLEILALVVCLVMFFAVFGRKSLPANGRLGAVVPLFILGVLGQALAPTAAYFITLPILLCGMASLFMQRWPDNMASKAVIVILAALVFGYMVNLGHLLMLGVGPDMLVAAILPAALAALAILPVYAGVSKPMRQSWVISGLALALALAFWIRLDPMAVTVPLYHTLK